MTAKTADPALLKMLDERKALAQKCERAYSQLKRTFNRLDKLNQRLKRLAKRIDQYDA